MSGATITHALVLAAGFGHRMRPLTDSLPKPLMPLAGKTLIDHVLDRLAENGVTDCVVNVHYLADVLERHLASRVKPRITISDERCALLDTGGAVNKARDLLGDRPFLVHNSDSIWIERDGSTLARMFKAWDPETMDSLLMLARRDETIGYSGKGDFHWDGGASVRRRMGDDVAPHVFAGVSINHPRLFGSTLDSVFSLNRIWDEALTRGRVAAIAHEGLWMHVGTPAALAEAERRLNGLNAA